MQINFVIIFFFCLNVLVDGIDEDKKFGENNAIKEEVGNQNYEQQNANKVEKEDITPILSQTIKKEPLEVQNDHLKTKIKEPKIELEQSDEESFENEFDEQADQNVSSADLCNSYDDEDYNDLELEKRNEIDRNKIYKLKRKLGQKRERTDESEETKMELIRKFNEIRKEKICGFKYDLRKRNEIEQEIAKKLGNNRMKIYKWKRELEFGIIKKFSKQQKIEKIKQFEKVKEEFTKKFNLKSNRKIDEKIAQKIGVVWKTIYRWKKKFGFLIIRERKFYSDAEKLEYVKRSEEMRKRNPMISERKIADKLGISNDNLRRWKTKFGTKSIH